MPWFVKTPKKFQAEQFFLDKPLPFGNKAACYFDGERWYVVTAHAQPAYIVDGDWIIPEPDGSGFYPCKPDIFESMCYPCPPPDGE